MFGQKSGLTALATSWLMLHCGPVAAQSLVDELQGLVESHPQIQSRQKSLASAGEGINAARAGYLPTVKLTGDTGPEYVDSPSRRLTEGRRFYKGRESTALTVTQRLFDGGLTNAAVDAAQVSKQVAGADLRAIRQNAILEGVLSYLDVLRQNRLIQLSRDSERKVQEQLNLEDERVQKGAGITSDVLAAKQRLQVAKERRVKYEGDFQAAVAKYAQVFGHGPDLVKLSDPPVPADLIPPQLEEAIRSAEKENPTVETAGLNIDLTAERRRSAESGYYPSIDLVGKADYENDKNATIGVRRDWSLLVTANWELFSGFKTDAQVAQATFDNAAAKDNLLYANRKASESVKITWYKLKTAGERISLLENAAVLAEEVWEAQKKRREAGKATVQDVLDDETRINDARINYTGAYYDMIQNSYELLHGMGRLEVSSVQNAPASPKSGAITPPSRYTMPKAAMPVAEPAPKVMAPAPLAEGDPMAPQAPPSPVAAKPAYIPVTALSVDDGLPDGSPAAMARRAQVN